MNILFIADPNSIHDIRWINFFSGNSGFFCFLLPRISHFHAFNPETTLLDSAVRILPPIQDPSTIRPLRTLRQAVTVQKMIRRHHIDILHIMYAEPNALWANFGWLFNVPMILTTRGTDILKTIPAFLARRDMLGVLVAFQYRRALNQFNCITCTSHAQVEFLKTSGVKIPACIVRTGVDFAGVTEKADASVALAFGIERPFVLMPRGMKPIYNHEFTLDAIGLLQAALRKKFVFVFVDAAEKDDVYTAKIVERAETVDADIRFLPTLTHRQLFALYQASDLVVMNPHSDGSPVSAMEAMACKVPVVLPPLKYDRDVFGNAWFFQNWLPVSLKETIESILLADAEALTGRIENNFRCIELNGNSKVEMPKVKAMYEDLVQR